MVLLIVLCAALCGGWISRMCGGAPPKIPWGLDQWLYALPYLIVSLPGTIALGAYLGLKNKDKAYFKAAVLAPYLGAVIGKRTGHGGGIDLGTWTEARDDEALEFLIKPLHGRISEYWYDVLLLSVTGLMVTIMAGSIVWFVDPLAGALIILSGIMKGPAYMIGWAIYPKGSGRGIPHLNEATAIGEFLTGAFGWAALAEAVVRGVF